MKINSRTDYALSCILRIADGYKRKKPVTVGQIAEKEAIDSDYVERLCVLMKKRGILKSLRGKSGGYILAMAPSMISAKDVLLAIDKYILETVCFRKKGRRKKCIHIKDCKIRSLWEKLGRKMEVFLESQCLDKLLCQRRKESNW